MKTLMDFEAEDRAEDATRAEFIKLGKQHALFAIDQINDYEDSRASHQENLYDTFAENHKGTKQSHLDAAIDAYNATWNERKI
jgi:hypothetical protein